MDEAKLTPKDVKALYHDGELGYDSAIRILMDKGFTEYAADKYLFDET